MKPNAAYKYDDISLFLVLIPLINAFNYYFTYSHISFSWFTFTTYCRYLQIILPEIMLVI